MNNNIYSRNNFQLFMNVENQKIPTLIFIHGFMGNSKIWKYLFNNLYKYYKIIIVDLPGHGKSKISSNDVDLTIDNIADDVIKWILIKKYIKKAIFIGHSMGGYVALSIAKKIPEIFSGLCLLHSTAESDNYQKKKNRINSIKLINKNFEFFISENVKKWFNPKKINSLKKELEFTKKIALSTPINVITSLSIGMTKRKNRISVLRNTSFPKLYIIGKYDLILDKNKIYKEINLGYRTSSVEISTGHMAHLESPKEITKILKKFVSICSI
ncbi:alpha/beta fold hydrolase [Blattabacterium cuenoti]|uniref:alpha/beta fold hydrolase n=1 Tax=Blattabacterium cuenoti TaxID=1653831 RepID=UPI001EEB657B|nr:alpha/beta fold hydrolase [Blattabacterium cuenoti]